MDVLATLLGQYIRRRPYPYSTTSMLSLGQAAKLMKVVANNSRSTVQLIEIELSKAYLYRAHRRSQDFVCGGALFYHPAKTPKN